ncbi:MAG: hypothetical protein K6F99_04210 [Lachnospiraceae bacterium]|nr:hypothetical protein [Lachnospiraceae bacterium]
MNNTNREKEAYSLIHSKATSNAAVQGLSGFIGYPYTFIADGVTIFTHFVDMYNKIRILYGREPSNEQIITKLIVGLHKEVLFDIAGDKILGNVPVIGIYFNAICAKTLTWRLGILFTMLASGGKDYNIESITKSVELIRNVFPQNDAFTFKQPSYENFEMIVMSVENNTVSDFERKITEALKCFAM